jgi:hypothetical protein
MLIRGRALRTQELTGGSISLFLLISEDITVKEANIHPWPVERGSRKLKAKFFC